jgi:hypothetical protein
MNRMHSETVTSAAEIYREKMFMALGDRNALEVLTDTADKLAAIVDSHSVLVLRTPPSPGKWTPNQIIGHLSDSEWVYGYRFRVILCENNPTILGTDQDAWVASLRHNERDPSELVHIFRSLREFNLREWKRISPPDLERCGQHNERGSESLGITLRLMAGHDLSHLDQIARSIEAVESRKHVNTSTK